MTAQNTNTPDRKTATLSTTAAIVLGFGALSLAFQTDPVLENDGAWMPVAEGVRFKVRSQQSDRVRTVAKQINDEYAAVYASASLTPAQNDAQDVDLAVRAVISDWEGVKTDTGEPVACTEESIRVILQQLPHLRRAVMRFSSALDNYKPKR